ncbi:MAG: PaaI family thioesterase [Myxococcota bacterium]
MSDGFAEALRQAKAAGRPDLIASAIPYARLMRIEVALVEDVIECTMPFQDMLIGNPLLPALHGGTLGALLESAAIFHLVWAQEAPVVPKTINLTVQYLRSGRPEDTYASATVVKLGRRVAAVRGEAWQSERDKPIATATANFLLPTPQESSKVP